jgi:2-polyprenyl-3-methyl-5-hydroxy-6-metoxy-1,4-benzoquinol methylase
VIVDKDLLNQIASEYHLDASEPDMFIENTCQRYELKWVKERVIPGLSVLDLGYGDGLFLEEFAESNQLTLVEGSSELASVAASRLQGLGVHATVVNSLFEDFTPEYEYDVVIASHVLEHVDDPDLVLMKIKSWLKPKGLLICIVPNRESLHRRLGLKLGLIERLDELSSRDKVVGHQRVYSFSQLKEQVIESGFVISEARGFFTKTLSNSQMLDLSEEVVWGLCQLSEDLPLELGANLGLVAIAGESVEAGQ